MRRRSETGGWRSRRVQRRGRQVPLRFRQVTWTCRRVISWRGTGGIAINRHTRRACWWIVRSRCRWTGNARAAGALRWRWWWLRGPSWPASSREPPAGFWISMWETSSSWCHSSAKCGTPSLCVSGCGFHDPWCHLRWIGCRGTWCTKKHSCTCAKTQTVNSVKLKGLSRVILSYFEHRKK